MRTTPSPSRSAVSIESARRAGIRVRDRLAGRRVDRPAVVGSCGVIGGFGVADDVAVDDDLDRVALVLVELGRIGDVDHLAVDADAHEALPAGRVEDPVALGLAVLDERAEDEQARPLRQREDLVDDLLDGLALDGVAVGAVRDADPREQQAQVVVDLGDRADRRARVARRALLVDGDGRREPVDLVDVGLLHLAEELARVGAQALDVAALALGVDGVEGQAALARTGQAGDDDEPVARERDVDVLEVVFACAANDELILGHACSLPEPGQMEQAFYQALSEHRRRRRVPGVVSVRAHDGSDDERRRWPCATSPVSGALSSSRSCWPSVAGCVIGGYLHFGAWHANAAMLAIVPVALALLVAIGAGIWWLFSRRRLAGLLAAVAAAYAIGSFVGTWVAPEAHPPQWSPGTISLTLDDPAVGTVAAEGQLPDRNRWLLQRELGPVAVPCRHAVRLLRHTARRDDGDRGSIGFDLNVSREDGRSDVDDERGGDPTRHP